MMLEKTYSYTLHNEIFGHPAAILIQKTQNIEQCLQAIQEDGRRWFYHSLRGLQKLMGRSERSCVRIIKKLKDLGILLVRKMFVHGFHMNAYAINPEALTTYVATYCAHQTAHKKAKKSKQKSVTTLVSKESKTTEATKALGSQTAEVFEPEQSKATRYYPPSEEEIFWLTQALKDQDLFEPDEFSIPIKLCLEEDEFDWSERLFDQSRTCFSMEEVFKRAQREQAQKQIEAIEQARIEKQTRAQSLKNVITNSSTPCHNVRGDLNNININNNIHSRESDLKCFTSKTQNLISNQSQSNPKPAPVLEVYPEINPDTKPQWVVRAMLHIWCRFELPAVRCTQPLARHLYAAFKRLNCDFRLWIEICAKITTSAFLMGDSVPNRKTDFKATLPWVLNFERMQHLLNQTQYTLGDRPSKHWDHYRAQYPAKQPEPKSGPEDLNPRIQALKQFINGYFGHNTYCSWFTSSEGCSIRFLEDKDSLLMEVTSDNGSFFCNYVETHHAGIIRDRFPTFRIQRRVTMNHPWIQDPDPKLHHFKHQLLEATIHDPHITWAHLQFEKNDSIVTIWTPSETDRIQVYIRDISSHFSTVLVKSKQFT